MQKNQRNGSEQTTHLPHLYIFLTTPGPNRGILSNMKKQCKLVRVLSKTTMACAVVVSALTAYGNTNNIPNRLIDYETFLAHAAGVGRLRDERRVTEEQVIAMSVEPGTLIFDARRDDKNAPLHIKGAKHLNLSEITPGQI